MKVIFKIVFFLLRLVIKFILYFDDFVFFIIYIELRYLEFIFYVIREILL